MENEKELVNRFCELSTRAYNKGTYENTYFLTPAEQALLTAQKLPLAPMLCGGYDGAERRLAVFGNEEICGYDLPAPIACIEIEAVSTKFADNFSHRDFLGALMNLGIKRDRIGDILIKDNVGYVFCMDNTAEYIIDQLDRIKHTRVVGKNCEVLPDQSEQNTLNVSVVVSSPRLDAVVSAAWKLSRSCGKQMVERELVSVNSITVTDPTLSLQEGDRVSLRGYGKFIVNGTPVQTKKGRLKIDIAVLK